MKLAGKSESGEFEVLSFCPFCPGPRTCLKCASAAMHGYVTNSKQKISHIFEHFGYGFVKKTFLIFEIDQDLAKKSLVGTASLEEG